jgi:hypothetical protein
MVQKEDVSIQKLREFKKKIGKNLSIDGIIFFGSRVRGTFDDGSDYDLLVVSKDFKGVPWHKRSKELYMQWGSDSPVELLCYTPEETRKAKENRWGIVSEAFRTGITI